MIGDGIMPSREVSRKTIIVLAIAIPVVLVIASAGLHYYLTEKVSWVIYYSLDETPSEGSSEIRLRWCPFNAPLRLKVTWESNYELTVSLNWKSYDILNDSIEWEATKKEGFKIVRIDKEDVGSKMYLIVNWNFPQGSDGKYVTFKLTVEGGFPH